MEIAGIRRRPADKYFWIYYILLTTLSVWIVWAAYSNHVEYSDGYVTVANSQYLLGIIPEYFGQRGPFLALWLTPAEYLSESLGLKPLDVRLHHLSVSVLHVSYIIIVAFILGRFTSDNKVKLFVYLLAITNYVFFSYSPFISHDLFPGAIFALMLILSNSFYQKPDLKAAVFLCVLGYLAAITKHIYGMFWVIILLIYLGSIFYDGDKTIAIKKWLYLCLMALFTGIAAWVSYSIVLFGSIPDVSFLLRPYYQIIAVGDAYHPDDPASLFSAWLYLRNFPYAYGITITLLLVPGILLSFRSPSFLLKSFVLAWLIAFLIMQSIVFKEVRYLAFLAPLTAVIIIPAVRFFWFYSKSRNAYRLIILGLLLVDIVKVFPSITHISSNFYAGEELQRDLGYLDMYPDKRVYLTNPLSYAPADAYSPFAGDRYHRLYHLTGEIVRRLYHGRQGTVKELNGFAEINSLKPGDILHFSSNVLVRMPGDYLPLITSPDKLVQFPAMAKKQRPVADISEGQMKFKYDEATGIYYWIHAEKSGDQLVFEAL